MFHLLVNRNDDLRKLVDRGYAVAFDVGYLVVRDVPYIDDRGELKIGALVAKLKLIDKEQVEQDDHQVYFAGSVPHGLDGKPIPNLGGGPTTFEVGEASKDVVIERSLSNKPKVTGRFENFFDKMESYVGIISGPAMERFGASPYTFRAVETMPDSVFKFHDTMTSRAETADLSSRFKNDVVAVIGLGGTGSYVLDYLVKTAVREIRAFDCDAFHVHNAFRSPGQLEERELGMSKVDVYRGRYDSFRKGLSFQHQCIDGTSAEAVEGVTFAFVCVDKGASRAAVFDLLIGRGIPFIDVGMGLNRRRGALNGMLRTTYYSAENSQKLRDMGLAELREDPDDEYRTSIQTSELNALNASLAVIKFKQSRGYYLEDAANYHLLMEVSDLKIVSEADFSEN